MKKIVARIVSSIVVSCMFVIARSQDQPVRYLQFDALTISDGLSQGMITCILQDRYGFMWFGTKDGLNRYDGYQFVVFRNDPSDSASIADNFVMALYEDAKGRLWVGTSNHGLDLFNRETETFTHLPHDEHNKNSLSDNRTDWISEDFFGAIWVSTTNGLSRVSIIEDQDSKNSEHRFSFQVSRYLSGNIWIFPTHDGAIWGSVAGLPLFRIRPQLKGGVQIDTLDIRKYTYYPPGSKANVFIRTGAEDTLNHILYLISEFSVAAVNTKTGDIEIIFKGPDRGGFAGRTICIDPSKTIWMSEHGFRQFDIEQRKWYRVLPRKPEQNLLLSNASVAYRDRSGIIWIGTKGYGLLKYNPRSEKFHQTDNESITWMSVASNNEVIIGKNNLMFGIFNPATNFYSVNIWDSMSYRNGSTFIDFGMTTSIVQDREGNFWQSKRSVVKYDLKNNLLQWYRTSDLDNFPVFIDRDQKIWTGTVYCLSRFDPSSKKFTDYEYPVPVIRFPYEFLQCIYQDSQENFWLGTIRGLLMLDTRDSSWKQFKNIPGDSSSISADIIFSICPDPKQPDRYLWIGTNGGGVNRFDKETGKCIRYSMKDGLPNNVVYGILGDESGNLWMSTNNGLCRFNPTGRTFKNFKEKDGLQGNEFNRYAYCKTENGMLFFGGVNGFNYFYPQDLEDNRFLPQVQITDFMIRNKPVSHRDKKSSLLKPIYLIKEIVLPYSENMITLEFTSMDFTSPENNLYQFRLDGFDKDWIQSRNNHSATYTNLNPGTYMFHVKGSNNDGIWNEMATQIQLIILPPWYMTWWFRVLVGATLAVALYGIYRYRLQQALHLQAVRNRIARDLHDEIGANLSSISIFSEVANEKADHESPELSSWLKKINEYTQSSLEAINDIVWVINSRNDRFENIILRMRILAAELFEAKNYELQLHLDESLSEMKLGMEARKNFYLIYKEALNNIAKYADCSKVEIELKWNRPTVHLKIKDNGKGFDELTVEYGNGLLNMKKRAEELKGKLNIHSFRGKGTEVELVFSI